MGDQHTSRSCSRCALGGLGRENGSGIRRFAVETRRILVAPDADFGNLIRCSPANTPGVIWLQHRPPTEMNVRAFFGKWLLKLSEVNLYGQLAVVEEDKLRIRGPIQE
jgi:hypothetical protein